RYLRLTQQVGHDVGVATGQRAPGKRSPMQLVGAAALECHQLGPQLRRERAIRGSERCKGGLREIGEHAVDAVEAGAGHEPDEVAGRGHNYSAAANRKLRASSIWARSDAVRARKAGRSCGAIGTALGSATDSGLRWTSLMRNS